MADDPRGSAATELLGVHVEALCEPCGVWHSVSVNPMQSGAKPITEVARSAGFAGTVRSSPPGGDVSDPRGSAARLA